MFDVNTMTKRKEKDWLQFKAIIKHHIDELVHDGYASVLSIQLHGIDNGYISKAED